MKVENITTFCPAPLTLITSSRPENFQLPYRYHYRTFVQQSYRKWATSQSRARTPARFTALDTNDTTNSETNPKSPPLKTDTTPISDEKTPVQVMENTNDEAEPSSYTDSTTEDAQPVTTASTKKQYSLRTRLREEIEAPFRKARMFVYSGAAASAGVGAFISTLRIIAALSGISGVQPLNETVPNVAIDLGVIALFTFLLRQEQKAGERRLERMSRGARISKLRLEDAATRKVETLKSVRGSKRIVVVAGRADGVANTMEEARQYREILDESSLRVIPLVAKDYEEITSEDVVRGWRFTPFAKDEWLRWFEEERRIVGKRLKNESDVIVIVIRLDGKVGARSVGKPNWGRLVEEVQRLPPKDQHGKP